MQKHLSRRAFNAGLLSLMAIPFAQALPLMNRNRDDERPYFVLRLPSELEHTDVAFQSFALDDKKKEIYGQFVTRTRPSQTLIAKYSLAPEGESLPDSIQAATASIGHQGLTVQHQKDKTWLWAAAPGRSRDVVRFQYQADTTPTIEKYTLFDESYAPFSITVAVSYDGKWLIAASRKKGPKGGVNVIRVFEMKAVLDSTAGDCSTLFTYEWEIPTKARFPVQGLACHDDTVAICYGTSKAAEAKPVYFFSLKGEALAELPDVNTGKATLAPRRSYEPEGLCYSQPGDRMSPVLFIGITTGRAEVGRTHAIYALE